MGEPKRVYNLIEKTCLTKEHLENIDDANEFFILSIYNGLMHCGNCGKRMKCATDLFTTFKRELPLDSILSLLDADNTDSDKIAKTVIEVWDILDENLTESQKYEIVYVLWDNLGIAPEDVISIFNDIYKNCDEYHHDDIEVNDNSIDS